MRTLAAAFVAFFIALPAWAGVEIACKPMESPTLPPTLCVMSSVQWKALSSAEQLKCPEHEIFSCLLDGSARTRFVTRIRRGAILRSLQRGNLLIRLIREDN